MASPWHGAVMSRVRGRRSACSAGGRTAVCLAIPKAATYRCRNLPGRAVRATRGLRRAFEKKVHESAPDIYRNVRLCKRAYLRPLTRRGSITVNLNPRRWTAPINVLPGCIDDILQTTRLVFLNRAGGGEERRADMRGHLHCGCAIMSVASPCLRVSIRLSRETSSTPDCVYMCMCCYSSSRGVRLMA